MKNKQYTLEECVGKVFRLDPKTTFKVTSTKTYEYITGNPKGKSYALMGDRIKDINRGLYPEVITTNSLYPIY